jgi:hypothetical protein
MVEEMDEAALPTFDPDEIRRKRLAHGYDSQRPALRREEAATNTCTIHGPGHSNEECSSQQQEESEGDNVAAL